MSLTTYCQHSEVRSALGVNDQELRDEVLALPVYEMGLVRELNKLSTSLNAAFSAVAQLTPNARTALQAGLFDATRLFAVYAVAKQVGVSLANFAPKDVTDGKASVSRLAGDPAGDTMAKIDQMYSALRNELDTVYAAYAGGASALSAASSPRPMFLASARRTDPVTGV